MNTKMNIPFSPPDISSEEIDQVIEALKSGWITTGPKTKLLEQQLKEYIGAAGLATFSSATTAEETALRLLGITGDDEVIVPAYTYTASASPVIHVGARLVLIDIQPGALEMDYEALEAAITEHTKAIIPVDLGGTMCDYDRIYEIIERKKNLWHPTPSTLQEHFDRIIVIADDAHALGASYKGKMAGAVADFSSFSFHAVKNFTTAEGGALSWRPIQGVDDDELYHQIMLWELHGQSKDALSKSKIGAWEYDIEFPGYKCNMTDILAAVGLAQFKRYPGMLARRKELIGTYAKELSELPVTLLQHYTNDFISSGHLMLVRLTGKSLEFRNAFIVRLAEKGVSANVHYKPLPMMSAYKNLGFDIADFPNAYDYYHNEVSLPLHTKLTDQEVQYICDAFKESYHELETEGVL